MTKLIRNKSLQMSAAFVAGYVMTTKPAHANNFSSIAQNVVTSIASLPALLSALCYMFGILLGVLGILKIKDHVENPGQTPIKDGAIRLLAGGALLALPIIFEAMLSTAGTSGAGASVASVSSIDWQ
ncbi:MAG: hypothetical protein HYS17_01280 [Micavibrio aeruginosavorus]|uniref:Type IV secretion protein IcmD n=1 Tax=Micavibrio aeruginosavorus TaxID=349221 RepID=A0A7T5UI95_9BACT|nr:MAG: hypothetical protein HYS17_01280 [Micavibrio aeruginosavorus]